MYDGMPYGRIQGQGKGNEPLTVRMSSILQNLCPPLARDDEFLN